MCRPFYLFMRFLFADNFVYNPQKMRTRAIVVLIEIIKIITMEMISFQIYERRERVAVRFLLYPMFILWLLSYYRATYAQSFIPNYNLSNTPQNQKCHACNGWQPQRASHCPICQKCIPKISTHFPCIANCVGYHNEKFFFLYAIYTAFMGWIYVESSFRYMDSEIHDYDFVENHTIVLVLFRIYFWIVTIMAYGMTFIFSMLSFTFFMCIWSNLTMIERMQGMKFNCPCCPNDLSNQPEIMINRNIYDRLWLQNLYDVLGSSMWKWPLPIKFAMDGNGFYFPTIPNVEPDEIKIDEEKQIGDAINECDTNLPDDELQKIVSKYVEEFKSSR